MFGGALVPLGVAELYLRAKDGAGPAARLTLASGVVVLTLLMTVGILGFSMFSLRILSGAPLTLPG